MGKYNKTLWTLEQGVALARRLEPIAMQHNAHIALGGSVLHKGESAKDLDIFVYPRNADNAFDLHALMDAFGALNKYPCGASTHDKTVFVVYLDGKRVDLFFVR